MSGLPDSLMYLPKVTSCCDFKANSLSPKRPEPELALRLQSEWPKPKSGLSPKVISRCDSKATCPEGELPLRIRSDWPEPRR